MKNENTSRNVIQCPKCTAKFIKTSPNENDLMERIPTNHVVKSVHIQNDSGKSNWVKVVKPKCPNCHYEFEFRSHVVK